MCLRTVSHFPSDGPIYRKLELAFVVHIDDFVSLLLSLQNHQKAEDRIFCVHNPNDCHAVHIVIVEMSLE